MGDFENIIDSVIDDSTEKLFSDASKTNAYMISQAIKSVAYNPKYDSFDVQIQDQYSEAIDFYLCKDNGKTNPTVAMSINDVSVTVANNAGAAVGDCINISEEARMFQSIISNVNGNIITFNTPVDYAFTTSAVVCFGEWNLATANGATTPVVFCIQPPIGAVYDIYDISVSMEDNTAMYESTFGGLTALTKGIVGRITDGYSKNLFLCSNNSGFREYGFATSYPDKVPSGTFAFWADKNFKTINGSVLRIDGTTNDKIEIIVQDNLTGLSKLAVTVHGHVVE